LIGTCVDKIQRIAPTSAAARNLLHDKHRKIRRSRGYFAGFSSG
jgi:hypothetical protein